MVLGTSWLCLHRMQKNLREILNAWVDIISDKNAQISLDHWNFWDMEE